MQLLNDPTTLEESCDLTQHVNLTEIGTAKLENKEPGQKPPELYPGVDYVVKDGGDDWLAFPDVPSTANIALGLPLHPLNKPPLFFVLLNSDFCFSQRGG